MFWPALDAIGKASGASVRLADGVVALIDAPYRPVPTAYGGIFRVTVREGRRPRRGNANPPLPAALDVAWEPRFPNRLSRHQEG